jgi:hypothetical protein
MRTILAFIPKTVYPDSIRIELYNRGGRSITTDAESDRFYASFAMIVREESEVTSLVEYVNSLNGVIKVDGEYHETYRSKHHLEIANDAGELNTTDGVYTVVDDA